MSDKQFIDGLFIKPPHERAPDFVKCSISIKRKDLGNWLRGKDDEWINIDVKEGKSGKWYAEVNDWKPQGGDNKTKSSGHQADKSPDGWPDGVDDLIPFMRPHDEYFG